jgi:hypothetical protein
MSRPGLAALVAGLSCLLVFGQASAPGRAQESRTRLVILLATDQPRYQVGEPVTFTVAVDNPTEAPVSATFSSAQTYDVVVSSGELEVWRWSASRGFAAVLTERTFPPGLTLLGRESWDWRDDEGKPVPPGTYEAFASLPLTPPIVGNSLQLRQGMP